MAKETYQVITDSRVRLQIISIVSYLSENVSFDTAEKVRLGIFDAIKKLCDMPTRHKIYEHIDGIEYRRALLWSYIIIFYIDEINMTVRVVDVVHSKQNPQSLLDRLSD